MWTGEELEGANGWSWLYLALIPFPCSNWDNLRCLLLSLMRVMEEAWLLFLIFLGTGSPFECSDNPHPMRKEGRKRKAFFNLFCFFDGFGLFCWSVCLFVCQGWLYNCWILCNKAFESRKLNLGAGLAPAAELCSEVLLLLPCCAHTQPETQPCIAYMRGQKKDCPANSQKCSCLAIVSLILFSACPLIALTRGDNWLGTIYSENLQVKWPSLVGG